MIDSQNKIIAVVTQPTQLQPKSEMLILTHPVDIRKLLNDSVVGANLQNRIVYIVPDDMISFLFRPEFKEYWKRIETDSIIQNLSTSIPYCFPPLLPPNFVYNPWTQSMDFVPSSETQRLSSNPEPDSNILKAGMDFLSNPETNGPPSINAKNQKRTTRSQNQKSTPKTSSNTITTFAEPKSTRSNPILLQFTHWKSPITHP